MGLYIYSLVCFLLPGSLWLVFHRKKIADNNYRIRHIIWSYTYMFYCYMAVHDAAGIGTIWDIIRYGKLDDTINFIPFSSEGAMTYLLNILMFMPLGFLLPLIWRDFRSLKKVVFVGFIMSLSIELCQLFCLRATDVDDLIMNTIGSLLGYGCWKLLKCIFKNAGNKCIEVSKAEPMVYLFGGILGIVFLYNWDLYYKIFYPELIVF